MEKRLVHPPRHIVWSTDAVDLNDPFQRRWLLEQTLIHGKAEDIRQLDFEEIARQLDELNIPAEIKSLWNYYFQYVAAKTDDS